MGYRNIIFDIDDTLTFFMESFYKTADIIMKKGGIETPTDDDRSLFFKNFDNSWYSLELHDINNASVRAHYHELYNDYLRFGMALCKSRMGLKGDVVDLTDLFIEEFGKNTIPRPNCIEVLKELSKDHNLYIGSNGLNQLQSGKLSAFMPYIKTVFISEAVGFAKPDRRFFDRIIEILGCDRYECLMVGDSLENDIYGANKAEIASCLYNPQGSSSSLDIKPKYEIKDFSELPAIC